MADVSDLFISIELPVMPDIGLELIGTLDKERTSKAEVAALIARDPVLAARLLGLANSVAFGHSGKIATLDHALSLVGLSRIRAMALSACLHNAFSMPEGLDSRHFWDYCMGCAGYARWLAEGMEGQVPLDPQQAWLAALMLRLGEVIIGHALPDALPYIEHQPCLAGMRWEREKQLAGFDEGEVMAELARRWKFPANLVEALLLASNPLVAQPVNRLAGVLHLAALLADNPASGAAAIDALPAAVMDALELKYGWLVANFPAMPPVPSAPG